MKILAVDPGNERSAWVLYDSATRLVLGHNIDENLVLLRRIREPGPAADATLVIEMVASYGMPVGREVFETCVTIGRFAQAWEDKAGAASAAERLYRRDVKLFLCGNTRAKDGNVRQALLDIWGGKAEAIGRKKTPGPLYGIRADEWQALAVAVTFAGTKPYSTAHGIVRAAQPEGAT